MGNYLDLPQTNPCKTEKGTATYRVARGGLWYYDTIACRVSQRLSGEPEQGNNAIGFRLVHP